MLAVIRLKSAIKASKKVKDSFKFVNLRKRNSLSLVDESMTKILMKLNPYVAWGKISKETAVLIKAKLGDKKFVALKPITLKSAKLPYPKGDLGKRDDMDIFVLKVLDENKNGAKEKQVSPVKGDKKSDVVKSGKKKVDE